MLNPSRGKHRSTILGGVGARQLNRMVRGMLFQVRCSRDGRFVPRGLVRKHVLGWTGAFVQAAGERYFLRTSRGRGLPRGLLGEQDAGQEDRD